MENRHQMIMISFENHQQELAKTSRQATKKCNEHILAPNNIDEQIPTTRGTGEKPNSIKLKNR